MKRKTEESNKIIFTAQLEKVSTTKDGGATIVLEVGLESLGATQALLELAMNGNKSLLVALTEAD